MKYRKIIAVVLSITTLSMLTSCKDKDEETVLLKTAETTVEETVDMHNLNNFRFTLYVDIDGKRYIMDEDGNKIYENEDGEFIDEFGNEITDYFDPSKDGIVAPGNKSGGNVNDAVNDGHKENQQEWGKDRANQIANNGGNAGDSYVQEHIYYSYERSVEEYNPQVGSESIDPGICVDIPLKTLTGLDFKGILKVDNVTTSINGSTCSVVVSGNLTYNTQEFIDYYMKYYSDLIEEAEQLESSPDMESEIVMPTEEDYKEMLKSTVITMCCGVIGNTYSNSDPIKIEVNPDDGNKFNIEFTGEYNEGSLWYLQINNISLNIDVNK